MTVWYHHPTIFKRRYVLLIAGLVTVCVALITTLFFAAVSDAAPGINKTINFQGRLLTASGAVVPDGNYNIQFKIYQDGDGEDPGNPGGTLKWTETYINDGGGGVEVRNGFLSVNLGSTNPFGTSVDWNQDTLWLSMNVAGYDAGCTTFGSSPCTADGEMLPMKRLTSTPYALNAGALNGKTADSFIQLAQGTAQTDTSNVSSIFLNKTGSGNLIQLQNTAADVFSIGNSGDVLLGSNADKSISVASAGVDTAGKQLSIVAGSGGSGSGSAGGTLVIAGGTAGGTDGNGGNVQINGGNGAGSGTDGSVQIGTSNTSSVVIGSNTLYVGNAGVDGLATTGGDFVIQGTSSTGTDTQGGSVTLQAGSATSGNANGGALTLNGGSGSGNGATGSVVISTPTFQTASVQSFAIDGSLTQSSIDDNGALLVNATASGLTIAMGDPTITTAGRVISVIAADGSEKFTLSLNADAKDVPIRPNTAVSMMWNGSDWIVTGTSSSNAIKDSADSGNDTPNVQIGDGDGSGTPTLLTVDKSASAPTITDSALLGSMYYDTALGKIQCYEADGWGACSSSPDSFVTLSPEYSGAVTNGTDTGDLTSDICSDDLDLNDGTSGQATVCDSDETYNFYDWTTDQLSAQTKSIFVTYQLPSNFKEFVTGSTSLMGRISDSTDAAISYQIFRSDNSGLNACSTDLAVTTTADAWAEKAATSTDDPSACSFDAGDSIVFKITLSATNDAHAYAGTLNFAFSND